MMTDEELAQLAPAESSLFCASFHWLPLRRCPVVIAPVPATTSLTRRGGAELIVSGDSDVPGMGSDRGIGTPREVVYRLDAKLKT
jgi:hypothetical protein